MENSFLGCGDRNIGSFILGGEFMMTVVPVLMMLIGASYFAVYMKKRKNNKEKEMGYKVLFAVVFLLLSVPFINMVITG